MYCMYRRAPVSSLVVTGNLLAFSNTMKCTVFVSVGISKQCNVVNFCLSVLFMSCSKRSLQLTVEAA